MLDDAQSRANACSREPWGRRLWIGLAIVALVSLCLDSYGITTWPMADDEVPSLVEMGLFEVPAAAFSVPAAQIGRLPRANLVWYGSQRWLLEWLPHNQLGFRLPSVVYGTLTAAVAFLLAARWRGLWFAAAVAIVLNGNPLFVYLSQLDRFYSLPLLLLTLTFAAMCVPFGGATMIIAAALLAALTVLSHNITLAVFVLAFLAAIPAYLAGSVSRRLVVRSGVAALVGVVLYLAYLRPIIQGWASTGNPTPVLISFTAYATVPVLSLAVLGVWLTLARRDWPYLLWWSVLLAGSICFLVLAPVSWNPRYFVFFMPAVWVLAAYAMDAVARSLGYRSAGAVWYGCVFVLLLPGLLSHYRDGSRHDYRAAAAVLEARAGEGQPILSDDAETISYYLPAGLRDGLRVRTKIREYPHSEFFLVARSNVWAELPVIPGRRMQLLAQISRRRFDEFSHVLRVYRVAPLQ